MLPEALDEAIGPDLLAVDVVDGRHAVLAVGVMALYSGARQGELLGLRWQDVDGDTITIRHTLPVNSGGELGEPKTKSSKRTLTLSPTAAALRRHKARQAALRLKAGRKWQDRDFVFTTNHGTPLDAVFVTKAFKRHLPEYRFHDLRHSYATLALEAGVALAVVSKSLGHSNVSTTADIYMDWAKRTAEQTATVMEAVLAG